HLTNLTVRAEFRGQAGDAVRAVDPDPREREQAVSRRGGPEALDRRTEKPGRTDGGEDARVVAAGRITEEIDRNVETPPDPLPRAGDLVPEGRGPERGQVEVIDRVRIDLPALANHDLDLPDRQLAVEQVADGEVEAGGGGRRRGEGARVPLSAGGGGGGGGGGGAGGGAGARGGRGGGGRGV